MNGGQGANGADRSQPPRTLRCQLRRLRCSFDSTSTLQSYGPGSESQDAHGEVSISGWALDFDAIAKVRAVVTGAEFYVWDGDAPGFDKSGSVHAKCAVADGEAAFITSANLTGAAMDRNMELGVLVRGGDLPKKLQLHLEALLTTRRITRLGS